MCRHGNKTLPIWLGEISDDFGLVRNETGQLRLQCETPTSATKDTQANLTTSSFRSVRVGLHSGASRCLQLDDDFSP